MRMLFTFAGGAGHLEPLVPIARAAEAAGHTVALCGRPWMVPRAESLGLTCFPAGSDAGLAPVRRPLAPVDLEEEIRAVGYGFAGRTARRRAPDVVEVCRAWRPDLLVCEEIDFGAMVAAEALGLPHATVVVIAAGGFVRPAEVAPHLDEVRAEHGLPPDPQLARLPGRLVIAPVPPGYRDPADPLPPGALHIRPTLRPAAEGEAAPAWLESRRGRPLVYLTLGTVFNVESGDLFERALAGLRGLDADLLVTVGRDVDPAELGPQPEHVHVAQYIPQALVLPRCRLVVSHGGSGSVLGALAHGLPMVLIPMGADQPLNGRRCEALGVARALDPIAATPELVRAAAAAMLSEPGPRAAAGRVAAEIAAMPGPERAAELLAGLVR